MTVAKIARGSFAGCFEPSTGPRTPPRCEHTWLRRAYKRTKRRRHGPVAEVRCTRAARAEGLCRWHLLVEARYCRRAAARAILDAKRLEALAR